MTSDTTELVKPLAEQTAKSASKSASKSNQEPLLSSNAVVELKGGMYTLMSLRLHSSNIDQIDAGIADKVQQAPGFFSDTPVVIDLSEIEANGDLDADLLLKRIREHKLIPVMASVTDKSAHLAQAIRLPLVETLVRRKSTRENNEAGGQPNDSDRSGADLSSTDKSSAVSLVSGNQDRKIQSSAEGSSSTGSNAEKGDGAKPSSSAELLEQFTAQQEYVPTVPMLVTRPVRSGQQLYARDTDLIIMAHVGPGAEIVADNNVHVYGPLRGRALCGVSGNTESRIFCQSLEAELVSVAGNYKVLEEIPEDLRGKPAQIWLQEGRLNIEAI